MGYAEMFAYYEWVQTYLDKIAAVTVIVLVAYPGIGPAVRVVHTGGWLGAALQSDAVSTVTLLRLSLLS